MKAKSIVLTILSVIFIGLLSFGIIWTVVNFDKLELAFSGTSLYTKEDIDNAYQDGYDTAVKDKQDLLNQITSLRAQLDEKTSALNTLNAKLSDYNQLSAEAKAMRTQIAELEKEISNLETSIASYEQFVKDVEDSNKLVATFMYDGAVYALQQYNSGDTVSIESPADTEEVKFNGWTVNGETVDLSTFTITESTTFVADIKYIYTVNFYAYDELVNSIAVEKGTSYELPTEPEAEYGYKFTGWSIDGKTIVDVNLAPSESLEYTAVLTKLADTA